MYNRNLSLVLIIFLGCLSFILIQPNISYAKNKKPSGIEMVEYESKDGFNMKGKLYIPKLPKGQKAPLVILLHSLGKDRYSWQNLPDLIKSQGFACLALDLRGHGKSIYNANLKKRYWVYFTHKNFKHYPDDIVAAVEYVQNHHHKSIDTNQVMLVGSDIGASAAVIAGSKLNEKRPRVLSLALISPTLKLKGLFLPIELVNFGKYPVVVFLSKQHKQSMVDTTELKKYAQGEFLVRSFYRGGIGAVLYKERPDIKYEIVDWAVKTFKPDTTHGHSEMKSITVH